MAAPVKHPRSSFLWFRRATPNDILRNAARLKALGVTVTREVKQSLGTRDPRRAKQRQSELSAEWDARWQAWRDLLAAGPRVLSQKEIFAIGRDLAAELIAKHSDNPGRPEDWRNLGDFEIQRRLFGEEMFINALHGSVARHLADHGLIVSKASRDAIIHLFTDHDQSRIYEALRERATGNYSEPQWLKDRPQVNFRQCSLTFSELHTIWRTWGRIDEPRQSTVLTYRRDLEEFAAFTGHEDASRVTPDDIHRYLEHLKAAGKLSRKSLRDRITSLHALFGKGVKAHKLSDNPVKGMLPSAGRRGEAKRKSFSLEEARVILAAARNEKGFKRWAPWLMAYSGMRVEEAAQLRKADVVMIDGTLFVLLADAAGHIKNRQDRLVPVHSAVLAEGFLSFLKGVKGERLFPEACLDSKGKRRDKGSRTLAPWVRSLGITDAKIQPSHGWRHLFKRLCEEHGVAPEARRRIEGRTEGLTEEVYGANGREAWLAREIEKIPPNVLAPI